MNINDIPARHGRGGSRGGSHGGGPFLRANPVIRIGGGRRSPLLQQQRGPSVDSGIVMGQKMSRGSAKRGAARRGKGRPATSEERG